jgi:hypothetical protein
LEHRQSTCVQTNNQDQPGSCFLTAKLKSSKVQPICAVSISIGTRQVASGDCSSMCRRHTGVSIMIAFCSASICIVYCFDMLGPGGHGTMQCKLQQSMLPCYPPSTKTEDSMSIKYATRALQFIGHKMLDFTCHSSLNHRVTAALT